MYTRTLGAALVGTVRNIAADGASTGSANNATVIQAAVDAVGAAGGGTVQIPHGTWITGPIALRTNVTLAGESWASVLQLKAGSNANFVTLFDGNTEHTGIDNLMLDCNGANQTAGNGVHLDNTGYTNNRSFPSSGDPNHYMRRVFVRNAFGHGVYTAGTWSQSHFDGVFSYLSGLNNFRIESPDNHLYNCTSAKSGNEGFYLASNSNRLVNCKSWLSGAVTAVNGQGFVVSGVDRLDFIGCEAQDNRKHGFALNTTTQLNMVGCRANRNGLGADGNGGVGDGIYLFNVTNSIVELVSYDHNNGGVKQRWTYNCDTGNDGNAVTIVAGVGQDTVPGIGSFGPNSRVVMTYLGKPVPQSAAPALATQQTGTTYTFVAADAGTAVEGSNASAQAFTIPPNSSVAFPVGTVIQVFQAGAGQITIAPGAGVTLRNRGALYKTAGQYASISVRKRATDEWVVAGDAA
jgi:hypothetical protein